MAKENNKNRTYMPHVHSRSFGYIQMRQNVLFKIQKIIQILNDPRL